MAEFILTSRGGVYPWHCDHMGHMNVMWYVGKFDEASWQLLARLGLTRTRRPDVRERALLMARGDFNVDTAIGDTRAATTAAAGL